MKLLRPNDVAEILGVSVDHARTMMKDMPCINLNASAKKPRLCIYDEDLQQWLKERRHVMNDPKTETRRRRDIVRKNEQYPDRIPRRKGGKLCG